MGTGGERIKPGGQPGQAYPPHRYLNAINAFFEPHIRQVWQKTSNAPSETSGNLFQLLPVSNADERQEDKTAVLFTFAILAFPPVRGQALRET